jgi:hypothetical protein
MSHIDALVTSESKAAIIKSRIAKLAQEGYNIVLNHKYAIELGNEEDTKKYGEAIKAVEQALDFHSRELASLNVEITPTIEE